MITSIINRLKKHFGNKEERHAIAAEYVAAGLPFQIHELREARGLTQTELAKRAGMAPERISVLEDPNYEYVPKIPTLQKIAVVFDVPLIVRFGTWSEVMSWQDNLSNEKLSPKSFDDEIKTLEEISTDRNTFLLLFSTNNKHTYQSWNAQRGAFNALIQPKIPAAQIRLFQDSPTARFH